MQLSFIFPTYLWLLLLLPALWALTLLAPPRLPRWRLGALTLLRTLAVAGLVLGLAGAQLVQPVGAVTTVFLLDGSDSVALSQRARAEAFVQQALAKMPNDDQAALIVFGQHALVERMPASDRALGQVAALPGGGATNIEGAVRLALALLPNEGHQRLVLLSDGGENAGDTAKAAQLASARGIPIDVVALSGLADGPDARISGVELPSAARVGQRLRMKINIESNTATAGRLTISGPGDALIVDQQVQLPQGAQTLEVALPEALPYFNRYVVHLETANDARPENNAAEAYSFVSGQPRVLLVEGQPGEAANLSNALKSAQIDVSTVAPAAMPDGLGALSGYDALALVNVPKRAVTDRAQAAISAYVHDLGRGLLMVGGENSFGAGGWRRSPIEEALPVTMDIPTQLRLPPVSIVILIDVSGSMSTEENGRTKISLAAEGAQRIAALLRDDDELTVVLFSTQPERVIGPLPGSNRDQAIEQLGSAQSTGGGINIHDGLAEAAKYIRQSDKPTRHIITITDGSDTVQQEGALNLVRELHAEKVTLSSIAIGDGEHVPFIRDMAQVGGGRTFFTDKAANLPTILADEAQAVLQPYIVEQDFVPTRGATHPILRSFEQTPQLKGYVITTPRPTSQVLLATPRGDPLLAAWQYGLGHALAWTSDFKGQWATDWVGWNQFPRFSAQLLGWLLPTPGGQNLSLQANSSGAELVLSAQALDSRGQPQTGLTLVGRMLAADGSSVDLTLREVGPGQYRAVVSDARPGAYLVQLVGQDARGQPFGAVTAGAVVPQSAEYGGDGANVALLEALASRTGGRMNLAPTAAFDANLSSQGAVREIGLPLLWLALLLLPFDIALRRLLFAPVQVTAALRKVGLGRRQASSINHQPSVPAVAAVAPSIQPPTAHQPPADTPKAAPDLGRLREAQERARRRARGEE
ncbi:MAG: VWA domain-containing protein [Roseiflexaceae bacterium]